MIRVLTKAEVEESNRQVDEWWDGLPWQLKLGLQRLISTVQNPIDENLPMHYADEEEPEYGTFTHTDINTH